MVQPVLVACTIVMILLMGCTAMLAAILSMRKKRAVHNDLRNLSFFLLVYMLFAFFQYYFQQNLSWIAGIKLTGCLADICYFVFLLCWVKILAEFSSNRERAGRRFLAAGTLVYGTGVELIVLVCGQYSASTGEFFMEDGIWKTVLLLANGGYGLWVLAIGLGYFAGAFEKKTEDSGNRKGACIFSGLLVLYMLWILLQDYAAVHQAEKRIMEITVIDPIFIIYSLLDMAVIYFFFKNDPLELFSEHRIYGREENTRVMIEENKLTKREGEILRLVLDGMNNPCIAENLGISENTVKRHLNHIFQKTGANNRYELLSSVWERANIENLKSQI